MKLEFSVYRYNPDVDDAPRMQDYTLEAEEGRDMMLLDALMQLKEKDPTLSFRRSCREGVCGSDGLNMNAFVGQRLELFFASFVENDDERRLRFAIDGSREHAAPRCVSQHRTWALHAPHLFDTDIGSFCLLWQDFALIALA